VLVLLTAACSRVDTLRLAYANSGTPVEWPADEIAVRLGLELTEDARPWLLVSVDDSAVVPFLLQASAGAIAITGARAAGFGPAAAGQLTLREHLLPGIPAGLMVKQRRLALDSLVLGDQTLLLVEPADWPHGQPRRGPAGVLGYDLFRRFNVEFDLGERTIALYRPGGLDVGGMAEVQRLAVLHRVPYFEAWLQSGQVRGRWLRLQFEPGAPTGICLDQGPRGGVVVIAGRRIALADAPCPAATSARAQAERDGIFGAIALQEFVVGVDYERGRIGFQPRD
jgi:hypothetical protein